jgi:hypothetical protein
VPLSFWGKSFLRCQERQGQSHNAIILWRCWVDRKPYDETRYLRALQKRHSPIIALAAQST